MKCWIRGLSWNMNLALSTRPTDEFGRIMERPNFFYAISAPFPIHYSSGFEAPAAQSRPRSRLLWKLETSHCCVEWPSDV